MVPGKAQAQINPGLTVGQQVPDVSLGQIFNNGCGIKKLSDLKGKLVILDFWGTYCSSCILAMHWMDSIQLKYGNKIHILEVADESPEKIRAFFKLRTDAKGNHYHFNTVVGDVTLNRLFPHRGVPHMVWIGPDRTVVAITDIEAVTEDNINRILNHQSTNFGIKKEIDATKPLFLSDDICLDSLSSYSIFLKGHIPSLGSGTRLRERNDVVYGRAYTNSYLVDIYKAIAYPLFEEKKDVFANNRLIINVRDSSKLISKRRTNGFFETSDQYTYELLVPLKDADSLNTYLISTLNRYTNYTCRIEKRSVKCLLLVRTDSVDRLKSKGAEAINTLFNFNPRFINCPLRYMVNALNAEKDMPDPVIDETGYTGNVDLQLSRGTDLHTLNTEFLNYGLRLVPATRERNMLVISDKKNASRF
jgi:thiol-disulfide isomerase/thioredoxin